MWHLLRHYTRTYIIHIFAFAHDLYYHLKHNVEETLSRSFLMNYQGEWRMGKFIYITSEKVCAKTSSFIFFYFALAASLTLLKFGCSQRSEHFTSLVCLSPFASRSVSLHVEEFKRKISILFYSKLFMMLCDYFRSFRSYFRSWGWLKETE